MGWDGCASSPCTYVIQKEEPPIAFWLEPDDSPAELGLRVGSGVPASLLDEAMWATPSFTTFARMARGGSVRRGLAAAIHRYWRRARRLSSGEVVYRHRLPEPEPAPVHIPAIAPAQPPLAPAPPARLPRFFFFYTGSTVF